MYHYVNGKEISARLNMTKPGRMTPMMFELNLIERAKANKMRIVLAEGEGTRILQATDILLRAKWHDIILLGNEDRSTSWPRTAPRHQQGHTSSIPPTSPKFDRLRRHLRRTAQGQGRDHRTRPRRHERRHLLRHHDGQKDDADGMVSGAVNTTAHTIRPAFEFIRPSPVYSVVSRSS